jgi:hypothetical protein
MKYLGKLAYKRNNEHPGVSHFEQNCRHTQSLD